MGRGQDLLEAARKGDITLASKILQHVSKRIGTLATFRRSPSINIQDVNGYTPLHHACLNGHLNIVCMLLAHEAIPDIPDIRGSTPLYLAAWAGHHEIVKTLLMHSSRPVNPNIQTHDNETPLHCAAQHGHNVVVANLLAYGADPTLRNDSFQTALDLAAEFGRLQVVQILIRTHPELVAPYSGNCQLNVSEVPHHRTKTSKTIFTHTCLHLASRNGHKKVVEVLLAAGVNVNVLTPSGTALHEAALCGKNSVVKVLLKAGIDINEVDGNGRTAMDLLKDYPPHVTYDIMSTINDHCKTIKERNKVSGSNENNGKIRTLPKIVSKDGKYNKMTNVDVTLPKNNLSNGLSKSMTGSTQRGESYVKMKPILPPRHAGEQKNDSSVEIVIGYKPVYNRPYLNLNNNLKQAARKEFISGDFSRQDKGSFSKQQPAYKCVDEYVVMSNPSNSNRSSIDSNGVKTPIPSPRRMGYGDYANINLISKSPSHMDTTPSEVNNNNKGAHSPTPDFPPPPATVAEHTILQYIQPVHSPNTNGNANEAGTRFSNLSENYHEIASPDSLSSHTSDNVEKFVGDEPFAGLFKGSSLNLSSTDAAILEQPSRLRSPDLVRAIKPIPAKRNLKEKEKNKKKTTDRSEAEIWGEIDTILEKIDNVVADYSMEKVEVDYKSLPNTKDLQKMLKIRSPSDLVMGVSSNSGTKWCHSAYTLLYGQVSYGVYYLGSTVIKQLRGTISARKSIQKLKFNETQLDIELEESLMLDCNSSTKLVKKKNKDTRLKIDIAISHAGVQFLDGKSTICTHDIENISCVCQDAEDMRHFAYITKENDIHYCHVFMVDEVSLASEIILTLGQAFEVAYQITLKSNMSPISENYKHLSSSPNDI